MSSYPLSAIVFAGIWQVLALAAVLPMTPSAYSEDVVRLQCLVGGCLGSFLSLYYYPINSKDSNYAANVAWQFTVNLILSGVFSPLLLSKVSQWSGFPDGASLNVAVATVVGLMGQRVVAWAIPWLKKYGDARASALLGKVNGQRQSIVVLDDDAYIRNVCRIVFADFATQNDLDIITVSTPDEARSCLLTAAYFISDWHLKDDAGHLAGPALIQECGLPTIILTADPAAVTVPESDFCHVLDKRKAWMVRIVQTLELLKKAATATSST